MRAFDLQTRRRGGLMRVGGKRGCVSRAKRHLHAPGGGFDVLEDRTLLSTLDITAGALTYDGTVGASALTVSIVTSGTEQFADADQSITLTASAMTAGWAGSGTNTVTGPVSSVNLMTITTSSTAGQSLTIDYTNGDPLPASGVTYDPKIGRAHV